jgi:hypothetical protein
MAQRVISARVKRAGRVNVIYRDTFGQTWPGYITNRDSATQADIVIWRGGRRTAVANVPIATAKKGTNVIWFITG